MKELRGKHALVTGAASGIGRSIALALAQQGAHLSLWDIDSARLTAVVEEVTTWGVRAEPVLCDLSQSNDITQNVTSFLKRWTKLDLLVNNAGVVYYGPTERMTAEQWDWLLQVNLHAPIQLTRELLPTLLAQDEAHVLNVSSIAGLVGGRRLTAYHVSKFGLVGFTESMRTEYAGRGLGFTALCPGLVQTRLLENAINGRSHQQFKKPPRWLCTTPEKVATKAMKAIRSNRGLMLVSPMAHVLWFLKRLSPSLFDFVSCFRRKKRISPSAPTSPPRNAREAA